MMIRRDLLPVLALLLGLLAALPQAAAQRDEGLSFFELIFALFRFDECPADRRCGSFNLDFPMYLGEPGTDNCEEVCVFFPGLFTLAGYECGYCGDSVVAPPTPAPVPPPPTPAPVPPPPPPTAAPVEVCAPEGPRCFNGLAWVQYRGEQNTADCEEVCSFDPEVFRDYRCGVCDTLSPTVEPVGVPDETEPTVSPVGTPNEGEPTVSPTTAPTASPDGTGGGEPTEPTVSPAGGPTTESPTDSPTGSPTDSPTGSPTDTPAVDNRYNITQDLLMAESEKDIFISAAARWEEVVTGDLADFDSSRLSSGPPDGCTYPDIIDDLYICGSFEFIDGPSNQIGFGKATFLRPSNDLPMAGEMIFDEDDLETLRNLDLLESLILHEMGHVMGIGTIWVNLGIQGSADTPCPYTGPIATEKFREISGCDEIPIEQTGVSATRCKHWDEECFNLELMTGELDREFSPLSAITIGNLEDMGYQVSYDTADAYTRDNLNPDMPGCVCDRRDLQESQKPLEKEHGQVFMLDRKRDGQGRSLREDNVGLTTENLQYAIQAGRKHLEQAAAAFLGRDDGGGNGGAIFVGGDAVSVYMMQNNTVYEVVVTSDSTNGP